MRRDKARAAVVLLALCAAAGAGCGSQANGATGEGAAGAPARPPASPPAWPVTRDLTCEQVKALLDAGDRRLLALNVSDEPFHSLGSIPGSLRIPWNLLPGRLAEVDRTRHVVAYCRRGVRSQAAYAVLRGAGYPNVWVMQGGIERWNALGYPTER